MPYQRLRPSCCQASAAETAAERRRLRAAVELHDRDAELAGLVGEILLNPGAGEDEDADRQHIQQRARFA